MAPYIIDIFESNKSVHEVHNKHRELTLLLVTKYVVQYSSIVTYFKLQFQYFSKAWKMSNICSSTI